MITYCFLALNILLLIGGTIGSVFVIIIVGFLCCITVVAIWKKRKRQNVRSSNTQQIELQNIGSLENTERTPETDQSKSLANTTLNTIPQGENLYSDYVIPPIHYSIFNRRPLQPCNESSNAIGQHEAQIKLHHPQQLSAPYKHQAGHLPFQQQSVNNKKLNQGRKLNRSAALTSLATLPAHNPIVQESKQQSSNNWQAPSHVQAAFGNPIYECLDDVHSEYDYYKIEEIYDEVKPERTGPPPRYTDLFKK